MKKVIIITALLFCAQIKAVHLSNNGLGQVLIFPYYTVNGGFNTLISLTNTTNQSKALRVRFREAANSKEVFTFNLYLGPKDAWVGALVKGYEEDEYHTQLINPDLSCTIPDFFKTSFSATHYIDDNIDGYGAESQRMHEGFIEVIEMGELTGASAMATLINDEQPKANCSLLQQAWDLSSDNPYWLNDANIEITPPKGGLMGKVEIINVEQGLSITTHATVLEDFSDQVLHFGIDEDSPNLADGKTSSILAKETGESIESQWPTGFEAVTATLMKARVYNEYVISESIGAQTDWIMTMPTRQFHTNNSQPIPPFNQASLDNINCEAINLEGLYNREQKELSFDGEIIIGTPPPLFAIKQPHLCYSVNNLEFANDDRSDLTNVGVFSSNFPVIDYRLESLIGFQLSTNNTIYGGSNNFNTGWASFKLSTVNQQISNTNSNISIPGLPVIGFSVQKYKNGNLLDGVLANYAANFELKSKTEINPINITPIDTLEEMKISNTHQGQVLIYPFYTVKNGMNSLISIVNQTDEVKAVKVRFREGKNSRSVFSFNLYLSAHDTWVAALVSVESDSATHFGEQTVKLLTADNSCTVPADISGQEFRAEYYTGDLSDNLGENLIRTQEGFLEVIDMGNLQNLDAIAASHNSNGQPNACARLEENWQQDMQWDLDPIVNLEYNKKSSLYGSLSIIDVVNGLNFSYDATAINRISNEVMHTAPESDLPNLASANINTTLLETSEGMIQTTWESPIDAVSALFMKSEIVNDFVIDAAIGAHSSWVNTYPTKQFYVDPLYADLQENTGPFNSILSPNSGACERFEGIAYDRDQQTNDDQFIILPDPPPPGIVYYSEACWSTTVIDINNEYTNNSLFDSYLNVDFGILNTNTPLNELEFDNGWVEKSFLSELTIPGKLIGTGINGETHEIYGKPVLGLMAHKYVNGNLVNGEYSNILANYAIINRNKAIRKIVITENN